LDTAVERSVNQTCTQDQIKKARYKNKSLNVTSEKARKSELQNGVHNRSSIKFKL